MLLVLASTFPMMALAAEDSATTSGDSPTVSETGNKNPPRVADTTTDKPTSPPPSGEVAPGDLPENAPSGNLKETVSRSLLLFTPSEEIDVDRPVDFPTNI
jgi:hypothetical protein